VARIFHYGHAPHAAMTASRSSTFTTPLPPLMIGAMSAGQLFGFAHAPQARMMTRRSCTFVAAQILFPVEWLQLDVLLHRDIETPANFESIILSQLGGYAPGLGSMRIPFDEKPQELSGRPPVLTSALWDRHDELMTYVFSRVGWSARDFRAHRLLVHYPPMQSTVIVRFPLPVRPQGS